MIRIHNKWLAVVKTVRQFTVFGKRAQTKQRSFYFSVLVFYTRIYVCNKNIQALDKQTKTLHLHCALPFWKHFPFHYTSFDPRSLVRPIEQVEFSHFEVTEKTSDLPKTTDRTGTDPSDSNSSTHMENCLLQGATEKPQQFCHVLYGFQMSLRANSWHFRDSN